MAIQDNDRLVKRPLTSGIVPISGATDFGLERGTLKVLGDVRIALRDFHTRKAVYYFPKSCCRTPDGGLSLDLDKYYWGDPSWYPKFVLISGTLAEDELSSTADILAQEIDGIDRQYDIASLVYPELWDYNGGDVELPGDGCPDLGPTAEQNDNWLGYLSQHDLDAWFEVYERRVLAGEELVYELQRNITAVDEGEDLWTVRAPRGPYRRAFSSINVWESYYDTSDTVHLLPFSLDYSGCPRLNLAVNRAVSISGSSPVPLDASGPIPELPYDEPNIYGQTSDLGEPIAVGGLTFPEPVSLLGGPGADLGIEVTVSAVSQLQQITTPTYTTPTDSSELLTDFNVAIIKLYAADRERYSYTLDPGVQLWPVYSVAAVAEELEVEGGIVSLENLDGTLFYKSQRPIWGEVKVRGTITVTASNYPFSVNPPADYPYPPGIIDIPDEGSTWEMSWESTCYIDYPEQNHGYCLGHVLILGIEVATDIPNFGYIAEGVSVNYRYEENYHLFQGGTESLTPY